METDDYLGEENLEYHARRDRAATFSPPPEPKKPPTASQALSRAGETLLYMVVPLLRQQGHKGLATDASALWVDIQTELREQIDYEYRAREEAEKVKRGGGNG